MRYSFWITAAMSLIAFCAMGYDKAQAKRHAWRVPERTLFLLAALLGAPGGTLGMWAFRHKTRHWYFALGFPLLALAQIVLLVWLMRG